MAARTVKPASTLTAASGGGRDRDGAGNDRDDSGAGNDRGGAGDRSAGARRRSVAARVVIALVRGYQLGLSPWLGARCRHLPSCSAYAIEAVGRFGALSGGWLALKRLGRCHPWGTSGYDPVPDLGHEKDDRRVARRP